MKLWKRNAVVAAIVLFVCVAVYLNWSYDQGSSVNGVNSISNTTAEKNLGEAALVNSDSALELEDSSAEPNSSCTRNGNKGERGCHIGGCEENFRDNRHSVLGRLLCHSPAKPRRSSG